MGVKSIKGENWQPYPAYDFHSPLARTPPFPDYVSAHSANGGTVFEAFFQFFGSDEFGFSFTVDAGHSKVEPKIDDPSNPKFVNGVTNVPNSGPETIGYSPAKAITVRWDTFSKAADDIAISRMYIGIHFRDASYDGITIGRRVGYKVWRLYSQYITGKDDTITQ